MDEYPPVLPVPYSLLLHSNLATSKKKEKVDFYPYFKWRLLSDLLA